MTDRLGITEITAPIAAGSEKTPLAVHFANEDQGGLKFFATSDEMTNFAQNQTERCFKSVAYVKSGENSYPSLYAWTGTKPDGTDGQYTFIGYIGGVVAADVDGAVSQLNSTFVFGGDFTIQQAGDQGNGLLIQLSDAIKKSISGGAGSQTAPMNINGKSVSDLTVMPPLQVDESQSQTRLLIKHGTYQEAGAPSLLSKCNDIKIIDPGVDTTIFCGDPITPLGAFFDLDKAALGIRIQEDDDRDPNLGGQLTELLGSIDFEAKAPESGNVKLWFMYHQNGAYLPTGYVTGTNGNPLIIEKTFNTGDDLEMILAGAYYAQGQETITMHVEHSFSGESMSINPEKTMFCVSQFENGSGTSIARIEFLRRLGAMIVPAVYKFDSSIVKLSDYLVGLTKAETEVKAGKGGEYLSQFGINNLTPCIASIYSGIFTVKDNGKDILDFYFDYLVDNTRTMMMRGQKFKVIAKIQNENAAFQMSLFTWTGAKNKPSRIYDTRSNTIPTLNAGWKEQKGTFIAKNTDRNVKIYESTFTIPNDAVNLAFVLYPEESQSPLSLAMQDFEIQPLNGFTGYAEIERQNLNEVHLSTSESYAEYGQGSEWYASLRYTLEYRPIVGLPMPMGKLIKGKAPFTLDKTRNVIGGSEANGGEGVLVAQKDGQVSISFEFILWNEQSTSSVVDFWLVLYQDGEIDGEETKIPDSEMQLTVPANQNTHGVNKSVPAIVFEIEKGQAFGLRGSVNKADGAFLKSTKSTDYMVRPVIDFKELTP